MAAYIVKSTCPKRVGCPIGFNVSCSPYFTQNARVSMTRYSSLSRTQHFLNRYSGLYLVTPCSQQIWVFDLSMTCSLRHSQDAIQVFELLMKVALLSDLCCPIRNFSFQHWNRTTDVLTVNPLIRTSDCRKSCVLLQDSTGSFPVIKSFPVPPFFVCLCPSCSKSRVRNYQKCIGCSLYSASSALLSPLTLKRTRASLSSPRTTSSRPSRRTLTFLLSFVSTPLAHYDLWILWVLSILLVRLWSG